MANVISGKSNLNYKQIKQFAEIFKLNPSELKFFQALVLFTQAVSIEEKNDHLEKMRAMKKTRVKKLAADQYSMYAKWHYPIILELLSYFPVSTNYKEVAAQFDPPIKTRDIEEAVDVLEQLGLIRKNEKGKYEQVESSVKSGDDIVSVDIVNFQYATIKRALTALEKIRTAERSISVTTVPLSKDGFSKVKSQIKDLRDKIMKVSEEDRKQNKIYQCNINFFPVTKGLKKDEGGNE